jgi:hypothetical protein
MEGAEENKPVQSFIDQWYGYNIVRLVTLQIFLSKKIEEDVKMP